MKPIRSKLNDALTSFWGKWFLLAIVTGFASGVAAIAFQFCLQAIQHVVLGQWVGFQPSAANGEHSIFGQSQSELHVWLILPVITLGGLATGVLVHWLAPDAEGAGTDGAVNAFHNERGNIPLRVSIVKLIASAITLGTGGSAGREGPIAHVCAGLGSFLGQVLRLSTHDRRILLAIGMGAGVGAIFRAPLAGAIFAAEILYRDADLEAAVIIPSALASTVAYSLFQMSLPVDHRFMPLFGDALQYDVGQLVEMIPFTILAFAVVAAAGLYVSVFHQVRELFKKLPILPHFKPMIGACLTGILGIVVFLLMNRDPNALATLGSGYGFLQSAITDIGSLSVTMLILVAVAKIFTSSFTTGSGGSGGVFGPSMVIGGSVGAAVGKLFHQWFPEVVTQPSAFAIVGMAGFFAGCANAPFSTILMVTELSGNYRLLLPTLWVASVCYIMLRPWSIYSKQVRTRLDSPAHLGDFTVDLLEGIQVRDAYRDTKEGITFQESASLEEIVHALDDSAQRYFHVYNSDDELVGIFSVDDVRRYLYDDSLWKVVNARDVMTENVATIHLDDDLNFTLAQFAALNIDELPVVDSEDSNKVIGVLRRKEAISAYNKRRLEFQKQKEDENRNQK